MSERYKKRRRERRRRSGGVDNGVGVRYWFGVIFFVLGGLGVTFALFFAVDAAARIFRAGSLLGW